MDKFIKMFEEATGEDGQELKCRLEESERQEAEMFKQMEEYEQKTGKPFIEFEDEL